MTTSRAMGATFVPGGWDDDYYMPPPVPELVSPNPQRINPEMPNQIQSGLKQMNLGPVSPTSPNLKSYANLPLPNDTPHLSPFPKLINPPPNVPPSDDEVEATLENARTTVLNSNDPDMQLAWAADALLYVGVCADNEERIAAAKPSAARSSTPRIEHQLKTDAMNIVNFLADQHHPRAEFLRGMWLEWGRFGQREDKREAFRCYSRAADREYARAEYRIGMLYESYNDPIKALRHYHRGVAAGDAASCYRLGMMTLRGQHGQPQDFPKALELIRKSADAADENAAQGAYVYGMLLAKQLPQIEIPDGLLPMDEQQAKMYIEKAAYLKFAKAQVKMGSAYELASLGCPFDPALSIHYNALASKQGEPEADMALSKWFLVGSEGIFPKNEELAYTYAERAAFSGLPTAEFAMGYFHEIGMFVPVDLVKAEEWYQKASKHGNQDAKGRLEGLARKQVLSKEKHHGAAITRIKSTYGSQHAPLPGRFQDRQQGPSRLSASTTADETNAGERTPPKRISGHRLSASYVAPRDSSRTPYPLDDRPPTVPPPDDRPKSVAPYPLEDGPPSTQSTPHLLPSSDFSHVQLAPRPATTVYAGDIDRPSSAFHIKPDVPRPLYDGPARQPFPPQAGRPGYNGYPPNNQAQGLKPFPAQPQQPYGGYGAYPGPALAPDGRPSNHRIASGPAAYQNAVPPRPPLPHKEQSAPAAPPPKPAAPQGPKIDIGYVAPPEAMGYKWGTQPGFDPNAEARIRHSASTPNFNNQQQPLPPPQQHQQPPAQQRPAGRPQPAAPGNGGPQPPPKDSAAPQKAPTPKPIATQAPAQPPAAKPPGKGPKTFDEMGIAAQKQDQDCRVM